MSADDTTELRRLLLRRTARRLHQVAWQLSEQAEGLDPTKDPDGVTWYSFDGEDEEVDTCMLSAHEYATRGVQENFDGWPERIDEAGWGVVVFVERAEEGEREPDPSGEYDYLVQYRLEPVEVIAPSPWMGSPAHVEFWDAMKQFAVAIGGHDNGISEARMVAVSRLEEALRRLMRGEVGEPKP